MWSRRVRSLIRVRQLWGVVVIIRRRAVVGEGGGIGWQVGVVEYQVVDSEIVKWLKCEAAGLIFIVGVGDIPYSYYLA